MKRSRGSRRTERATRWRFCSGPSSGRTGRAVAGRGKEPRTRKRLSQRRLDNGGGGGVCRVVCACGREEATIKKESSRNWAPARIDQWRASVVRWVGGRMNECQRVISSMKKRFRITDNGRHYTGWLELSEISSSQRTNKCAGCDVWGYVAGGAAVIRATHQQWTCCVIWTSIINSVFVYCTT